MTQETDLLWEDPSSDQLPELPIDGGLSACALLAACSAEAGRLVQEASALDATVAAALSMSEENLSSASLASLLTASLQGLDHLCQEIDGLARVLSLLAEKTRCGGRIPSARFLEAVKLGAQRRRLVAEYCSLHVPQRGDF